MLIYIYQQAKSQQLYTYAILILMTRNQSDLESDFTLLNNLFGKYNLELMTYIKIFLVFFGNT
jgi:hypothetical protein